MLTRQGHVRIMADMRLQQHGLAQAGWCFRFLDSVHLAGCCHFATRSICVSVHLVEDTRHDLCVVDNVVLHEIAHALAGCEAGHGPTWREVALRIGNDGKPFCNLDVWHPPFACRNCGAAYICVHRLRHALAFLGVVVCVVWAAGRMLRVPMCLITTGLAWC